MSFGERLKARREELGFSRSVFAGLLGVSSSAISNYENGLSFPKEEVMLRLFDCLQTEPNVLFQDSFSGNGEILSRRERELIRKYRDLSPVGRETLDSVVGALCSYQEEVEQSRPQH